MENLPLYSLFLVQKYKLSVQSCQLLINKATDRLLDSHHHLVLALMLMSVRMYCIRESLQSCLTVSKGYGTKIKAIQQVCLHTYACVVEILTTKMLCACACLCF